MALIDHIVWHLMIVAVGWLLCAVWPWIKQPTWPETPHSNIRYGWAILAVALVASLYWVFLFWLLNRRG